MEQILLPHFFSRVSNTKEDPSVHLQSAYHHHPCVVVNYHGLFTLKQNNSGGKKPSMDSLSCSMEEGMSVLPLVKLKWHGECIVELSVHIGVESSLKVSFDFVKNTQTKG